MIFSARQVFILCGYAIALILVATWLAIAARRALPVSGASIPTFRRHPSLLEQQPSRWLLLIARAVLVMALAGIGLATLLACGDSPQ